ncbi:MAG: class I SAM-dependent RNA methyltransferase [Planctomycetaceae bacterium]|nr:class I SAM-dependent RNA methyltransferase [Planctomycetaceae bacterium]
MRHFDLIATASFGLENVVAEELRQLGYADCRVQDGRVLFSGTERDIARCNLWLRSADRVLIRVGEFPAGDFGQLFDQTEQLPWSELLPVDARFPVKGRSIRSRLHSVPKVQSVTKKAIVESLKKTYQRFRFEETGAEFTVEVSLLKDMATLTIDTSGIGLHKRGYRSVVGVAPLRETIAAGLLQLSFWNPDRALMDPFCGSGTIPIEAALIGRNIAPGLSRSFISEDWRWLDRAVWKDVRTEARDLRRRSMAGPILASDHDPQAVRLAQRGATEAGVADTIRFSCQELSELRTNLKYGCVVTNPPYGERIGTDEEVKAVYRVMGQVFASFDTWSLYVLTSHREFERYFGRRAQRRRKLYNGRLECQFYQFPGPRPPAESMEVSPSAALPSAEAANADMADDENIECLDAANASPVRETVRETVPIDPLATFVADCADYGERIYTDAAAALDPENDLPRSP